MPDVVTIPTGELVHAVLAPALTRLFPDVTFHTRPHDEQPGVDLVLPYWMARAYQLVK